MARVRKEYTENDSLSVSELKAMKIGTIIDSSDCSWYAVKTDYDLWTFDDRIDKMEVTSFFIANNFEGINFTISEED